MRAPNFAAHERARERRAIRRLAGKGAGEIADPATRTPLPPG